MSDDAHKKHFVEHLVERSAKAKQLSDDELIEAIEVGVLGPMRFESKEGILIDELKDRYLIAKSLDETATGLKSSRLMDVEAKLSDAEYVINCFEQISKKLIEVNGNYLAVDSSLWQAAWESLAEWQKHQVATE